MIAPSYIPAAHPLRRLAAAVPLNADISLHSKTGLTIAPPSAVLLSGTTMAVCQLPAGTVCPDEASVELLRFAIVTGFPAVLNFAHRDDALEFRRRLLVEIALLLPLKGFTE